MNLLEQAGKSLLAEAGIAVPRAALAGSPAAAEVCAQAIGPVMIKAQVPAGKRGKAGGILPADSPEDAARAAKAILAMEIGGHKVTQVLVEERADIAREFYAAVLTDSASRGPAVIFSTHGGMDIEEIAAKDPDALKRAAVDIRKGFTASDARDLLSGLSLGELAEPLADLLVLLYQLYRDKDAELLEINPLAVTGDGRLLALDCKFTLDDSAAARQPEVAAAAAPAALSDLEAKGRDLGLGYIELDGDVGLLANGAGLTMTTMDAVTHFGGSPANFLEIGGEAYTKAVPALELVLSNPRVKSLLVNFCGAFARCDVMTEGVINAWETLKPTIPVYFSIHGTGEKEAIQMVRDRLGLEPFDTMDEAVEAAVGATAGAAR